MTLIQTIGREQEKQAIAQSIVKGENVLLVAPMYRGKTHLIYDLMGDLPDHKITPIYFNCMNGYTEQAFLEQYSKQILKSMSAKIKSIFEDSQKYLPNIRPKVSMNSINGVDIRIEYQISSKDVQQYLSEVMDVPNKIYQDSQEQMVIILDEFQAVQDLKGLNILEVISRTLKKGVSYVFVSSKEQEISRMLTKKKGPDLQIRETINLGKVPANVVYFHIENSFKDQDIKVTTTIIDKLISSTEGEIAFITRILSRLITRGRMFKRVSIMDISTAIREFVSTRDDVFYQYFDSLSTHQKSLIIAIAKEGGKQVFKGQFIYENGLNSVPSVQTSIVALMKKSFIHKENNEYLITNFFFKEWLKRNFL